MTSSQRQSQPHIATAYGQPIMQLAPTLVPATSQRAPQTLTPAPNQRPRAERGHQTSKLLSDMPRSVQQAAVPLQGNMQEEFRRRPRRLDEVFFDGKRRYRPIYNHLQDWRVVKLSWLPSAMRGPRHARDTEPQCALLREIHPCRSPATTQPSPTFT
uniref:Uncharacterized protein n=1 Tax=Glossina austeni TaxID=7395 RepID=A0A1A9V2P4_GLOAU